MEQSCRQILTANGISAGLKTKPGFKAQELREVILQTPHQSAQLYKEKQEDGLTNSEIQTPHFHAVS
jgi:hypothetical protein